MTLKFGDLKNHVVILYHYNSILMKLKGNLKTKPFICNILLETQKFNLFIQKHKTKYFLQCKIS